MAISSDDKTKLLKVVVGLFNAAPGNFYLPQLETAVENGMSISDLAQVLALKPIFTGGVMGSATTSAEQAAILAANFGLTADDVEGSPASKAIAYFTNGIDNGVNIGTLVYNAVVFLANQPADSEFASVATLLENKALVSATYSASLGGTDLATLQNVLSAVTGDAPYTEEDVTQALADAGIVITPPTDFTLTASADSVSEGQPLTYTVTASQPVAEDTVVTFNVIIGDSAAADQGTSSTNLNDFVAGTFNPVTVTIPAGSTTATFEVTAANDGVTELPENFSVTATVGGSTLSIGTLLLDGLVGETFALTVDPDIIQGTAGNDQIFGLEDGLLTSSDIIDGAAGVDTLSAELEDTYTPVISNVEIIKIRAGNNNAQLDMTDSTGYTQLIANGDGNGYDVTFDNISEETNIGVANFKDDYNAYFNFTDGVYTGTDDTITIDMGKNNTDLNGIEIFVDGEGDTGIENVIVTSFSGVAGEIEDLIVENNDGYTMTSLVILGNTDLDDTSHGGISVEGWAGTAGSRDVSVDASAFTGDLDWYTTSNLVAGDKITFLSGSGDDMLDELTEGADYTVDGGDGDDTIVVGDGDDTILGGAGDDDITTGAGNDTVDGGDGDDRVDVDVNLTEDDSLDGGDGIDTFATTSAEAATIEADNALLAVISNFEVLGITNALAHDIDLTTWGFDGGIELEVADASAGTVTIASGGTITISDNAGTTGALVADVDGASDAGSNDDVLNVVLAADYNGANNVTVDLSVDFVETVNLTVTDTDTDTEGTGTMTLDLSNDERVETINVTSDQNTVVTGTLFSALDTVDASGTTGDFTIDVSGASQGVVVTSGTGDDTITGSDYADIISTGDGDDYIAGSTGADSLTGGDGEDEFDFSVADLSTTTDWTTIEDFAATASDADQITTVSGVVEANSGSTDVSAADDDTGTVTASITDGVITLGGLDKANIDTLDEWIAVTEIMMADATAGVLAFEFDGNTYVVESDATDAIDNIIELAGVTGIEAIDTTAGANTILIA